MASEVIQPALTWTGDRFERDLQIEIDSGGRIAAVGRLGLTPTQTLQRQAIIPGLVSAHSHGFQRGLRGRGDLKPAGQGSFWSWRESMYALVGELDPERFRQLSVQTFREMLAAGITTVGEFHYLHHNPGSADYAYDELILEAAREAGIRLVLLNAFYRTGGIGKPLEGSQKRFATPDLEQYWRQMDRLAKKIDSRTQSLGAAAHSIRAATPDEIASLYQEATGRGLVFHMHLEEQQREIDDAAAAYGKTPMRLLLERLDIGDSFTAVHCTHTAAEDLEEFLARGGNLCVAPLTEASLGDGIPNGEALRTHPEQISLGTDSNARISMLEEMRWLEYAQRLASQSRGAFRDHTGRIAPTLLRIATAGGARSLGVNAGVLAPGAWADLVAINLDSPQLTGCTDDGLIDALVFGGSEQAIVATFVGGRCIFSSS